jgi:hypothetical protein
MYDCCDDSLSAGKEGLEDPYLNTVSSALNFKNTHNAMPITTVLSNSVNQKIRLCVDNTVE